MAPRKAGGKAANADRALSAFASVLERSLAILKFQRSQPSILTDESGEFILPDESLSGLLNSAVSSTHVLVVNDRSAYFVHAPILARRSAFFASMLEGAFQEATEHVVHITCPCPGPAFDASLAYLYTVELACAADQTIGVLMNARYLAVDKLIKRCVDKMGTEDVRSKTGAWSKLDGVGVDVELTGRLLDAVIKAQPEALLAAVEIFVRLDSFVEEAASAALGAALRKREGGLQNGDDQRGARKVVGSG
ncbi:hypothetical protein HK101_000224, partial [Irineochytrium annulatum]